MQGYMIAWLILAVALGVAEAATTQLVAIWFCLAALCSMIGALCGVPIGWQIGIFVLVSFLLLLATRPFVKKVLRVRRVRTNADMVEGGEGLVTESIDNLRGVGRVEAIGLDWSARSESGEKISAGQKVRVLRIDGVKLIVEKETAEAVAFEKTPAVAK